MHFKRHGLRENFLSNAKVPFKNICCDAMNALCYTMQAHFPYYYYSRSMLRSKFHSDGTTNVQFFFSFAFVPFNYSSSVSVTFESSNYTLSCVIEYTSCCNPFLLFLITPSMFFIRLNIYFIRLVLNIKIFYNKYPNI